MIDLQKKIGEIASENANAIATFELLGIDYCCNGDCTFENAARTIGVTPGELFAIIATAAPKLSSDVARDWRREPTRDLISHIVGKHHAFNRSELSRLSELCDNVISMHRDEHPELVQLKELLANLKEQLQPHMLNEEQTVFPFMILIEESLRRGRPTPVPPFGTLERVVTVMHAEHERVASLLREMRSVTFAFHNPLDASSSYRTLMTGLLAFEQDLHFHMHLENNVLFPRALASEDMAVAKLFYDFAADSLFES